MNIILCYVCCPSQPGYLKTNEHFDTLPSFRGLCPRIIFSYVRVSLAFVLMKGGDNEKRRAIIFIMAMFIADFLIYLLVINDFL